MLLYLQIPRLFWQVWQLQTALSRGVFQHFTMWGMLLRKLRLRSKRDHGLRMRYTRTIFETIPGERRVPSSKSDPKLSEHLPSELLARICVLCLSATACLTLNVQNAGFQAQANKRPWNVPNNPTQHLKRHLPCKRLLCTCQRQILESTVLPWRAQVVHHVHKRDKLIRLGNI